MAPNSRKSGGGFVHPIAKHAKRKISSPFAIQPIQALGCFLAANLVSALFAPIQDCDETFNYWEPTHYLSHGYGLQTWEYSPEFAIRSWFYVGLHAAIGSLRSLLPWPTKVAEFYFVRYVLAFVCALCQTLLFRTISTTLNGRIGVLFLLATILSPGNFHASTAYLPSSFSMYTAMLGAAAFMNWRGGIKTPQGIFWFAVGGILGWPFAAALCTPFIIEEMVLALFGDREGLFEAAIRLARGGVSALLLIFLDLGINTFFYRKPVIVSWNIIKYNIFSETGGPNLYGTEPWTFYFRNLALNFNVWFVLALLTLPLFVLQKIVNPSKLGFQSALRTIVFASPFYMWLAIFSLQPHKEERFMFPAYPFLALNAAISSHILLSAIGGGSGSNTNANIDASESFVLKIPAKLRLLAVAAVFLGAASAGILRTFGLYRAYSGPLRLYSPLGQGPEPGVGGAGDSVCFGKEWYRFPTSYFLPRDMHAKFIRSEFRGLLPGEFSEARTGFGIWGGTWLPTSGLNNRNEEDMSKYVEVRSCDFLVDTQFARDELPPNEPDYVADKHWEVVKCEPFLDASRTHALSRAVWVPDFAPERLRRRWGRHCLLKRVKS